jgi:hypothetical protein
MATPIEFDQQNFIFDKPESMTDEECVPLPVHKTQNTDHPQFISCWQLDEKELAEVAKTGKIYLSVFGDGHQPVSIAGQTPFIESFDLNVANSDIPEKEIH